MSTNELHPDLPPPRGQVGVLKWLRENFFSSPINTLLTIVTLSLSIYIIQWAFSWGIFEADWIGNTRAACETSEGLPRYGIGACWVFIKVFLLRIIYGFYPDALLWRPTLVMVIAAGLIGLLLLKQVKYKKWIGLFTIFIFPLIAGVLLYGGYFGLEVVETHDWGGLVITLVLSWVGIVAALPLGITFALARRSQMPVLRTSAVIYIEFLRGVPLITILFMASVMLPLFLPEGTEFNRLIRMLIGIIMFQTAYMAEVIRGGLQAIPKGQYEAADALGLSYWKKMSLIILPQALKILIPGIVNTFISLFKDTTLVYIVGLFDVLNMLVVSSRNSEWVGFETEGFVFAAIIFWVFCFSMSQYSQNLEKKLHTGHKR